MRVRAIADARGRVAPAIGGDNSRSTYVADQNRSDGPCLRAMHSMPEALNRPCHSACRALLAEWPTSAGNDLFLRYYQVVRSIEWATRTLQNRLKVICTPITR